MLVSLQWKIIFSPDSKKFRLKTYKKSYKTVDNTVQKSYFNSVLHLNRFV